MSMADEIARFDFLAHERATVAEYLPHQQFYADLASVAARILEECLKHHNIKASVQFRAKDPASLGHKSAIPSEADPNRPKYAEPLKQITDLAGVRVITQVLGMLPEINGIIHQEFAVLEQSDKSLQLIEEEKFGYQSIHYLVKVGAARARLAEYRRFSGAIVELQVRTILQHAWAEIEHDIQYKSSTAYPEEIRRRFMALAGMLEIADREFQAIQGADKQIIDASREKVARGELSGVEITPLSLKQFLDKRLGQDFRIADWSYDYDTRLVKTLGFTDLKQIEDAISGYDDNVISTIIHGLRQGQLTRFELMLLAALGERFIERHPWRSTSDWFEPRQKDYLKKLSEKGITTGTYDPKEVTHSPATEASSLSAGVASGEAGLPWSQVTSDVPPAPSAPVTSESTKAT
jgi:putative GTP pyrophosphokinase